MKSLDTIPILTVILLSVISGKYLNGLVTVSATCSYSVIFQLYIQCIQGSYFHVIPIVSCTCGSIYCTGTPILIMDACSKSRITLTCTLQVGKETLQWVISKSKMDIIDDRIVYLSSDRIGLELEHTEDDLHIEFNLTSRSPLTSTLTANSSNLFGTTVSCLDEIDSPKPAHMQGQHCCAWYVANTVGPSSRMVAQNCVDRAELR